jgi:hypothetical protein
LVSDYGDGDVEEILAVNGSHPGDEPDRPFSWQWPRHAAGTLRRPSGVVFVADAALTQAAESDYADVPTIVFAPTFLGPISTDSPRSVTLVNDSKAPLDFATPGLGFNPAITPGFTVGGASTCPKLGVTSASAHMAPGASCTDLVSFTPVAAGSISGRLVTSCDALNLRA